MERKETKKQLPIFQFFLLYLRRMETPHQVIQAAGELIQQFGSNFEYLGQYKGKDAYMFAFPEDAVTGFPFIYLFAEGDTRAREVTGYKALDILASFGVVE